ncbi:MAG: cytochrome b N-terminal domain-containing protein [Chloroflexota bacterium]
MESFEHFGLGLYRWFDERLAIGGVFKATLGHSVPKSVNWWYVFGSMVLTAFIFQVVTGIFLAFTYQPSTGGAYSSLDYITHHLFAGNILRGLHYWGASAMVLLIFIHMTAHFLTGSYKYPRELHWWTGAVLLVLTIVMAFTGQLLRWNQDAYWAIVVGAEQAARTPILGTIAAQLLLGGPEVNGNTLTHIYAIHIWLIPGAIFTFIGVHLYLVIYKGVSEWPVPGRPVDPKTYWAEYQEILHTDGEPFFPRGMFRDAVVATLLILVIGILAVTLGAEALGPKANPVIPANPKPDWYLIWYFAVLALIGVQPSGPAITPFVIILFPAIAFGIVFLIPLANKGERHYSRRPWAIATAGGAAFATLVLIFAGYAEPWKPYLLGPNAQPPGLPHSYYAKLSASEQKGAILMDKYACLACHQINAVGGHRGPDLTYVGERIDYGQFIWRIAHGGGGMPAYGNILKPNQVQQLVLYLETRVHTTGTAAGNTGG